MNQEEKNRLCEKAIALVGVGREAALELAITIDRIDECRAYETTQHGTEDLFRDALGFSEGNYSKYRTVGRAIRSYGLPIVTLKEVPSFATVYQVCRASSKEAAEEALQIAATTTTADFQKIAAKVDDCSHDWEEVTMRKCRRCKVMERAN